jgi:hypothetical protein
MRRELTIRCVSTGTVRADSPDGARCELREWWLELDGIPAHARITESRDRGQCTRDTMVEFDRIVVRGRAGHEVGPPASPSRLPLDWLLAIAESLAEGEHRTVSLWVRSLEPAALLHATPVVASACGRRALEAEEEGEALAAPTPSPHLRLVAAAS